MVYYYDSGNGVSVVSDVAAESEALDEYYSQFFEPVAYGFAVAAAEIEGLVSNAKLSLSCLGWKGKANSVVEAVKRDLDAICLTTQKIKGGCCRERN